MTVIHARKFAGALDVHPALLAKLEDGKIEIHDYADDNTYKLRRFLMGAVIPYVFYQLPHSGWANFKECWLALKLEFYSEMTWTLGGKRGARDPFDVGHQQAEAAGADGDRHQLDGRTGHGGA